jgi:hypothetical protein
LAVRRAESSSLQHPAAIADNLQRVISPQTPLNDVQRSLLAGVVRQNTGSTDFTAAAQQARSMITCEHAGSFLSARAL